MIFHHLFWHNVSYHDTYDFVYYHIILLYILYFYIINCIIPERLADPVHRHQPGPISLPGPAATPAADGTKEISELMSVGGWVHIDMERGGERGVCWGARGRRGEGGREIGSEGGREGGKEGKGGRKGKEGGRE
jgi:hypothetical protein